MLQYENGDLNMALGENIRRLRRDKSWTQQDLAEQSGVKMNHISKLERNEADPKLETIYKLLNAFDCSPNSLLQDVKKTSLDGRIEMALERVQKLPDKQKNILLDVIDKYCMAISLHGLVKNQSNEPLGLGRIVGETEEMSFEDEN